MDNCYDVALSARGLQKNIPPPSLFREPVRGAGSPPFPNHPFPSLPPHPIPHFATQTFLPSPFGILKRSYPTPARNRCFLIAGCLPPQSTGWAGGASLTSALATDHPDVATTYNNLGNAFHSKGDYDAAGEYHEKALAIKLRVLGPDQGGGCDDLKVR